MKLNSTSFHLKVQKIEQICLFELSWGQGQNLTVQVDYPTALTELYQDWRQAYLNFYQSDRLRGRTVGSGVAAIVVDWHQELVRAESKFLYEFHRWLRSAELYEIRARIASQSQHHTKTRIGNPDPIQVFLTCAPIELDRFPWEAWELGTEFATLGAIRIIRAPLNIGTATHSGTPRAGRARILAILGDDTGLNFEEDREAVRSLLKIADIQFVGWQPNQSPTAVIQQISDAIDDPQGWDVLFFAGHSNETEMTGGELGIAPGVSLSIREITPQLRAAKQRGLQVAIFNSCSGLSIADSLIDLGFSQVVVMREPIHNRVAQEFLVRFLQGLAKHLDVYESIMGARQLLRMEKSHTYPSAWLVPSLFCHPGAKLYRITPHQWKNQLRRSLPSRIEAIALVGGILLSGLVPVQSLMQDGRLFVQAAYRNLTGQFPAEEAPPVALVQIDKKSLFQAGIPDSQIHPINRSYLAKLIDRLRESNASIVGVDVVLDTPQKDRPYEDRDLGTAVRRAVDQKMWLTFAADLEKDQEIGVSEATRITSRNWTLHGYANAAPGLVELPTQNCRQACPMAYLISLVQAAQQDGINLPTPQTDRVQNLRTQLLDQIDQTAPKSGYLAPLLKWQQPFLLQPLIDFSLPPNRAYTVIPAWKLIDPGEARKVTFPAGQVVLIAAGDDERLGFTKGQPDRITSPSASYYWTQQPWLTGGELQAYMMHHLIKNHLVIPIPDLWLIGLAVLLGKALSLLIKSRSLRWNQARRLQVMAGLTSLTVIYGLIGLQVYVSLSVLLPWLFPASVFLAYVLPATRKRNHD